MNRLGIVILAFTGWATTLATLLVVPVDPAEDVPGPKLASVIGAIETQEVAERLALSNQRVRDCLRFADGAVLQARLTVQAGGIEAQVHPQVPTASRCLEHTLESLPLPRPPTGTQAIVNVAF